MGMRRRIRTNLTSGFGYGAVIGLGLLLLVPLYWLVVTSFLAPEQILRAKQTLLPNDVTVENYSTVLTTTGLLGSLLNSLLIAVTAAGAGTVVSALAGYAFAKLRFPGRDALFLMVLAMMMVPVSVTIIPNFILMVRLGIIGSLWAVILLGIATPFGVFWMRQYIHAAVHDELIDAARVDGAGEIVIFRRIVAPMILPGLAGLVIWLFLTSWNALLVPLVFLQTNETFTYPVFLAGLVGFTVNPPTNLLIAGSVIATIPALALFILFQRWFVSGIATGAVRE